MASGNLLVTGATGHQGGALISALLATQPKQFEIFAVTRNPSSTSAVRLASRGVIIIEGDTTNPDAIFTQVRDLYGVFLVTAPNSTEKEQAIPFINAARAAGVQHFIFTSVDQGKPRNAGSSAAPPPHYLTKLAIEKHLQSAAAESKGTMKWTILRPTSFMENLSPNFIGTMLATMLKQLGSTRISLISTADIGRVAALAFEQPDKYGGRELVLTGDVLSYDEMNTIFREETGKDFSLTFGILVNGLQWAITDLGMTMRYFANGAYDYDMDAKLSKELGLRHFRTWLREDSKLTALKKP